jgi:hypothetical protein
MIICTCIYSIFTTVYTVYIKHVCAYWGCAISHSPCCHPPHLHSYIYDILHPLPQQPCSHNFILQVRQTVREAGSSLVLATCPARAACLPSCQACPLYSSFSIYKLSLFFLASSPTSELSTLPEVFTLTLLPLVPLHSARSLHASSPTSGTSAGYQDSSCFLSCLWPLASMIQHTFSPNSAVC